MNELYHHGVRGQKWGVRRYQNPDGSLTPKGRKHLAKQFQKELNDRDKQMQALTIEAGGRYSLANRLEKRGKTDRLDTVKKSADYLREKRDKLGRKQVETLKKAEKYDLMWKSTPTEYNQANVFSIKRHDDIIKDVVAKYGKDASRSDFSINASSGNRYKLKPKETMSDKQQSRYKRKQKINSHSPQKVTYVMY